MAAGVIDQLTSEADRAAPPADEQTYSGRTLALVEAALLLDIVVVLCLVKTLLPIPGFQGLVRLVCPTPFVLLGLRHGPRTVILATVGGFVVLSALVGPLFGNQILVYGALGTAYSAAARWRLPYLLALGLGAVIYGTYIAFLSVGLPLILGVLNLHISAGELINKIRDQLRTIGHTVANVRLGPLSAQALPLSGPRALFHWTLDHWLAGLVAIIAIYGIINSWAFLYVTREILGRVDRDVRLDAEGKRIDFYPPSQL